MNAVLQLSFMHFRVALYVYSLNSHKAEFQIYYHSGWQVVITNLEQLNKDQTRNVTRMYDFNCINPLVSLLVFIA